MVTFKRFQGGNAPGKLGGKQLQILCVRTITYKNLQETGHPNGGKKNAMETKFHCKNLKTVWEIKNADFKYIYIYQWVQ